MATGLRTSKTRSLSLFRILPDFYDLMSPRLTFAIVLFNSCNVFLHLFNSHVNVFQPFSTIFPRIPYFPCVNSTESPPDFTKIQLAQYVYNFVFITSLSYWIFLRSYRFASAVPHYRKLYTVIEARNCHS